MPAAPTLTMTEAEAALLAADAAHEPVPDAVLERLLAGWRARSGLSPELNAALHRLPPDRFAHVSAGLRTALADREAELVDSTPVEFAEWVDDPTFAERWIDSVETNAAWALRTNNFDGSYHTLSTLFDEALGGGAHAAGLLDRALERVARHARFATTEVGARLRLMFRRVRFMMLRGTPRTLDSVLPGADIRFVTRVHDAVGKQAPLAGLSRAEVDTLFQAWSALDWDGTLYLDTVFIREATPPPIETRPWAELAALVEQTALARLATGERTRHSLTRLFARPEPLADRVALAESIATFAKTQGATGHAAMRCVLAAIVPHVAAAGQELPGALAAAALRSLGASELPDVLLALPEPQVRGWLTKLGEKTDPKQRALAKTYTAALARRSPGPATSTAPKKPGARKPARTPAPRSSPAPTSPKASARKPRR